MNNSPLLSVCLITYNHVNYIEKAIESVLEQKTSFTWNLIIADDYSTDGTREILIKYKKKYPDRIHLILQESNVGAAKNWLDLIQYPKSKYIAYFEGDDYWTDPYKLQKQVDFLEANKDYVLTGHNASIIDEKGNEIQKSKLPKELQKDASSHELKLGHWILTLSMVFRNVLKKDFIELLSKKDIVNGDTALISHLGVFGKYHYMPEIKPAAYRMHSQGVWSMKSEAYRMNSRINLNYTLANYYYKKNDPIAKELYSRTYNLSQNNKDLFTKYSSKEKLQIKRIKYSSYYRLYGFFSTFYLLFKSK